ncbi:MAG TPA: ABC transporter ATP-binding protein [bacterium]|nr:ABC transporter ATP-binding protein [bacterium]HPN29709.1 ABC transporter ATP-binding protein [bacterium]
MIDITDLFLKYDNRIIFNQLNLKIKAGEIIVVCGQSGSGKSSFLNCVAGVIPEIIKADISGKINKSCDISMVIQNPHNSSFGDNVVEELAFYFENKGMKPDDIFDIIYPLAEEYKIHKLLLKDLNKISAGQKQRTSIVSCLSQNNKIVIMDEPFTLLDNFGKSELIKFIKKLKQEGAAIIISEHNISYIEDLFDKLIYFNGKTEIYDRTSFKTNKENLEKKIRTKNFSINGGKQYSSRDTSLNISNLSYKINGQILFDNVNLEIHKSNIIGLTGENGSGKTTLLKMFAGMSNGYKGKIKKDKKICYIDQDPDKLIYAETVENEINFENKYSKKNATDIMNKLGIEHLKDRNPLDLSVGEKHRVSLAAGLINEPDILLIDEPAAGLDKENLERYFSVIEDYAEIRGKTVITALTDYELAERYCSRIYKIENKKIMLA